MRKKTIYISIIVVVILLCIASLMFRDGLVFTSAKNYASSIGVNPEKIELIIKSKHFDEIKKQREEAFKVGSIVNDGNRYVPAKIIYKGDTLKVELRLKGHMLDHLQGDKWSYRVKVKNGKTFMGMTRFTLQHPGTRNYTYEWMYHQLMKNDDVVALNYNFINVNLNGDNLGVYALEEHFAQELLEHNNRPPGALIRFNPNLYWIGRIMRDNQKFYFTEEYTNYNGSFPEAYDDKNTFKDSVLRESYLKAQSQLERFKRRELSTSEVFDVKKLASFHAIIDLVGGHHSLDWSDVKYYYNTSSNLIEPIAYESFSAHEIDKISGSYQFYNPDSAITFHNYLFSDKIFFLEYIKALQRISESSYLDEFLLSIDEELKKKLSIIYSEFPYKDFTTDVYYINQRKIKEIIGEKKPFHVFLQKIDSVNNTIEIALGTNSSLPYYLTAIKSGNAKTEIDNKLIFAKKTNQVIQYQPIEIKVDSIFINKLIKGKSTHIYAQLPGLDLIKEIEVFLYPFQYLIDQEKTLNKIDNQFIFSQDSSLVYLPRGEYIFNFNQYIPKNSTLLIEGGTSISLANNAQIIAQHVIFSGTNSKPIYLSGNGSNNILQIQNGIKDSELNYTYFKNVKIKILNSTLKSVGLRSNSSTNVMIVDHSNVNLRNAEFDAVSSPFQTSNSELVVVDANVLNSDTLVSGKASRVVLVKVSGTSNNVLDALDSNSELLVRYSDVSSFK